MNIDLQSPARFLNFVSVRQGKQLHPLFLKRGVLNSTVSIANRLLQMYVRCEQMTDAKKLFDEMPERRCFTWNTLLEGYVKMGRYKELLEQFYLTPHKNDFTWNVVISGLAKGGDLVTARHLFTEMPSKSSTALNLLIHGYANGGFPNMALRLFKEYSRASRLALCWDSFVLASSTGACADLGHLNCGKQIHTQIIVAGVETDSVLGCALVNMYAKCGDLDNATLVFGSMDEPDDFSLSALISGYADCGRMDAANKVFHIKPNPSIQSWNSLIAGYIANDGVVEAIGLFGKMHRGGVNADECILTCILSGCCSLGVLRNCQQLHSYGCKLGLIHDLIVSSAFVDLYAKCGRPQDACNFFKELRVYDTVLLNTMIAVYSNSGRIENAKQIFETMPYRNLISWNSMIVGLSQNGCPLESLHVFCQMNRVAISIDEISLASVISACGSISCIEFGEQLFGKAIFTGLDCHQIISSSLIDFYCKCGLVECGRKVFDNQSTNKMDVVIWNSMLMGYATNGYGMETIDLFNRMTRSGGGGGGGVLPSGVTFIGVLSGCDHCGLVEEALELFHKMKHEYGISPEKEHYCCMVDLLARAGCVEEAFRLVQEMPFKADASTWISVLRGCVAHGDIKNLGKKVVDLVIQLDPENSAAFLQLSNLFSTSGDWKHSALVRKFMKDRKIEKNPGRSWGAFF